MKLAEQIEAIINLLATPESWTNATCARTASGLQTTVGDPRACQFCLVGAAAKVAAPEADTREYLWSPYDWFNESEVGNLIVACLPQIREMRDTDSIYSRAYVFNDVQRRHERYAPESRLPGTGHAALMAVLEEAYLHAEAAGI